MTRWLVTGAAGMLGQDLTALLAAEDGEQLIPLTRAELDITDPAAVYASLDSYQPDAVVNCAAWTAVDEAETHEQAAIQVNGKAVALLAGACADRGITLVQVSTDYVFDGTAREPYREDHPAAPRTAYGRTKLAGERAVLAALPSTGYVVRTAWLYGARGNSFVATMLGRARTASPVSVVDDQRGQPTWTADVARQIRALVDRPGPRRGLPRNKLGGGDVVRAGSRGVHPGGREPGAGIAGHERRLPAPGAAAGLQRARARRVGGRGHQADRGLAGRARPGVSRHAGP